MVERLRKKDSALETMFLCNSEQGREQQDRFNKMMPFRLQLESSGECSADCSYCYAKVCEKKEPLSTREIKSILRAASGLGIRQIDWMGGDPMERSDWIELMQTARYYGMTNNLWTSGPRLNDIVNAKRVIELTDGGYVVVHLDSLDPEILTSLRDSYNPRTIHDTLKGLELLIDEGKSPSEIANLIMLTNLHTPKDVEDTMVTMLKEYGIHTCLMSVKPVDETGQLSRFSPRIEEVSAVYKVRDDLFFNGKSMGCQDFPKQYCGTTIFISMNGKVSSCYAFRRYLGSVREQSLEDIVSRNSSSLFFTEFRQNNDGLRCGSCDLDACWGCRANAFYFGAGAYGTDPLCKLNEQKRTVSLPY